MGKPDRPELRVFSAHQKLPDPQNDVGKLLLAIGLMTVAFLACFLAWIKVFPPTPQPVDETRTAAQSDLSNHELKFAVEQLEIEVRQNERALDAAFFAGDEPTLLAFLTLQAESAGMQFGESEVTPLPRDGVVRPIELTFTAEGNFYDLPIFLDGLFRQRSVLIIETLSVTSKVPLSPQVDTRVTARLYRPVKPGGAGLLALASQEMGGLVDAGARGLFSAALQHAATLEAMEGFRSEVSRLSENSDKNRQRVMETLPRILKALPSAPYGQVYVDMRAPKPKIQTDQNTPY